MFVTFHCDAYENISYFNGVAKQLLSLMGHSGTVPGALKFEQVPEALDNLQRGLGLEKGKTPIFSQNKDDDDESEISLAKRAIPLIHLLEAASKKNCDVLWMESRSPG